jgi:hypothetical protein
LNLQANTPTGYNVRYSVPHGNVRTASGVWSFPDELEPHWLPDA